MKNIALITNQEFRIRDYGTDSYLTPRKYFLPYPISRFYYYEHCVFAFRPVDIKGMPYSTLCCAIIGDDEY